MPEGHGNRRNPCVQDHRSLSGCGAEVDRTLEHAQLVADGPDRLLRERFVKADRDEAIRETLRRAAPVREHMHLVRCRVVDQSRFQRRDVEQQVAPPILHLAQRAHLSRVIDDQIVHSSLGIRIAFVHLEVNQFAVLLGLGVQLEDFAHSFVQLLLDFRRPLEVAPVAVAHREPQELLVPVEMVSQVDGLDLVENARRLDVQPDQPGHRIRRLVEGGDLRVLLELQFPIGVLQHLLGTETDELKESHGLLIGNGDVLAPDLEDVLAQRRARLIIRQRRIDAAEHGELVDLRQQLERSDGCRFDEFGDVLVVLVRLLGHSMLLKHC